MFIQLAGTVPSQFLHTVLIINTVVLLICLVAYDLASTNETLKKGIRGLIPVLGALLVLVVYAGYVQLKG